MIAENAAGPDASGYIASAPVLIGIGGMSSAGCAGGGGFALGVRTGPQEAASSARRRRGGSRRVRAEPYT